MYGIKRLKLNKHIDKRGVFRRIFCEKKFKKSNSYFEIKQINLSTNPKNRTLRGLHYQIGKSAEKKIVYCTKGKLFFVAINIDKNSKNYLKYKSFVLNEKDNFAIFIDTKYATGFLTQSKSTELLYLMSKFYKPSHSKGFNYNDPKIKIKWPSKPLVISKKDKNLKYI